MTSDEQRADLADLYPVGEKQPDRVWTRSGRPLADLTLANVLQGELTEEDFGITAEGLRRQADIADRAGRPHLAENLRRGAELVAVPDEVLLDLYERLRPGRAGSADELRATAEELRQLYGAERTARLFDEAARAYERRGVFGRR
jgi:propanediol dehydratase small subunit